jgi:hypothetical protein
MERPASTASIREIVGKLSQNGVDRKIITSLPAGFARGDGKERHACGLCTRAGATPGEHLPGPDRLIGFLGATWIKVLRYPSDVLTLSLNLGRTFGYFSHRIDTARFSRRGLRPGGLVIENLPGPVHVSWDGLPGGGAHLPMRLKGIFHLQGQDAQLPGKFPAAAASGVRSGRVPGP